MFKGFSQTTGIAFVSTLFVLLILSGCGVDKNLVTPKTVDTPGTYTSAEEVMSIIKSYKNSIPRESRPSGIFMAPSSGVWETSALVDAVNGGEIPLTVPGVTDQVVFKVLPGALVADTTISMKMILEVVTVNGVDDLGNLDFEMGPSGTQFDPHAQHIIPFEVLFTDGVDTFSISVETGGQIEEGISYDIDTENQVLIAYVPHFSKYYYDRP